MPLSPSQDVPGVTLVPVTFNSADVLPGFFRSLDGGFAGMRDWDVVVVDNASSDESLRIAEESCVRPRVVRSDRNAGFAAGVNLGLAEVPHDRAVLLANPDVRFHEGCALALVEALAADVALVAPQLREADGSLYPSLRRDPSVARMLASAVLGDRLAGRLPGLGELVAGQRAYSKARDVAWAGGAVLLLAPGLTERIGTLDESFFLYSEETEYALRARRAGFRVTFEPTAVATHLGGESTTSPKLYRLMTANKVRLFAKFHPRWKARLYRQGLRLHQAMRVLRGKPMAREGLAALRDRTLLDG